MAEELSGSVLIVGELPLTRGDIVRSSGPCSEHEGCLYYQVRITGGYLHGVVDEMAFCESVLRRPNAC